MPSSAADENTPLLKRITKSSGLSAVDLARCALAFWLELQIGMIASSLGSLLGSIQDSYDVSYTVVSLISLADAVGRFVGCATAPFVLHRIGFMWTLVTATGLLAVSYITIATVPPFAMVIAALAVAGLGAGVLQPSLATYVAHYHEGPLMSIVYAGEGLGALIQPFIIQGMMAGNVGWNHYFLVALGMCLVNFPLAWALFRNYEPPKDEEGAESGAVRRWFKVCLMAPVIYGALLQILAYAAEDSVSTWIVSFMSDARKQKESNMQSVLAAFWGGTTLGRTALAHLTHWMGTRIALTIYLSIAVGSLIVLQFVTNVYVDAATVAVFGFLSGPSVPTIVTVTSDAVPASLVSPANSVLMTAGVIGTGIAPVVVGFINSSGGLRFFPATMMAVIVLTIAVWQLSFTTRKLKPPSDERNEEQ